LVTNIAGDELDGTNFDVMCEMLDTASLQVVEHDHFFSALDERVDEMAADESRTACHQDSHD
jgi:hypothetical protein